MKVITEIAFALCAVVLLSHGTSAQQYPYTVDTGNQPVSISVTVTDLKYRKAQPSFLDKIKTSERLTILLELRLRNSTRETIQLSTDCLYVLQVNLTESTEVGPEPDPYVSVSQFPPARTAKSRSCSHPSDEAFVMLEPGAAYTAHVELTFGLEWRPQRTRLSNRYISTESWTLNEGWYKMDLRLAAWWHLGNGRKSVVPRAYRNGDFAFQAKARPFSIRVERPRQVGNMRDLDLTISLEKTWMSQNRL